MAIATDEAGIQFRTLNASKGAAVRATRAQADRVLYRQAIRRRIETAANLTLFQQPVDDLILEGDACKGCRDPDRTRVRGCRGRADHRDVSVGFDSRGAEELRSRARGRSAGQATRRPAPGTEAAGGAAEDRHAAAPRRPHDRLFDADTPTGRRTHARVLVRRAPRLASTSGSLLDHPHNAANARHHPVRPRSFAAVHRRDQGRRSAVLPFDRRQGRPLRSASRVTRSFWSRKVSTRPRFTRTASRRRCHSTCSSRSCARSRDASAPHILRPGYSIEYDYFDPRALRATLETKAIAGYSSPARSTARRATKKPRHRASWPASTPRDCAAERRAGARAATKPIWACSSTT